MFWEFARVIDEMGEHRRPHVLFIENVVGFASSHDGRDLHAVLVELNRLGYSCDLFAIDARHFVPQSRPRMFIVGVKGELLKRVLPGIPPLSDIRPEWIRATYLRNPDVSLHYLELPPLPEEVTDLSGVVEPISDDDPRWWDGKRTHAFIESLSPVQRGRFDALKRHQGVIWRTAYRRTRNGKAVWEIRRDALAGCLRTTGGGSSKQALLQVRQGEARVRWMTPAEYARLMGACDYSLKGVTANQALFGFGDAVVVDVIRWIGQNYLVPVLRPVPRSG
jgi:DNA (cytosine-5)-methyltransferase 1